MKKPFEFTAHPKLENPYLIVGWNEDTGKIASGMIDFLNEKLGCQNLCEIEPMNFFSMGGVSVEDDYARFPESKFFYSERNNLVIFKSNQPIYNHYIFLNSVLDVIESFCRIKELYTINGMVSSLAHTAPRRIFSVFNKSEFQERLQMYGLEGLTWEGAPAVSSFLLWIAERRGIPGLSLWIEVPFYLATLKDLYAVKIILSFLNQRFDLKLDIEEFDSKIKEQNEKIDLLREEKAEVNKYISLLESGLSLDEDDQLKLTKEIHELFKR
jgi:proteasome assembly chaperone (PAC2) family protein